MEGSYGCVGSAGGVEFYEGDEDDAEEGDEERLGVGADPGGRAIFPGIVEKRQHFLFDRRGELVQATVVNLIWTSSWV